MLEHLDLVSKYEELRKCISKELESLLLAKGFRSIAHAKYIMGPSALSQCQYDGRMQATDRVSIDDTHLSDFSSSSNDKNYDNYTLSLVNGTFNQLERDPLVSDIVNSETIQSNRLRQPVNDPLIWFGLLVPKSLRKAQMRFNQGLREMINLLNSAWFRCFKRAVKEISPDC
ncbi:hypothetical protein G9A89_020229 [Geosiphon pyriformis]|nr:hypothetical protein G9A89_020229 [Geosiphon pyriformis]